MVVLIKSAFELMLEESIGLIELNFNEVKEYGLPKTAEERRRAVSEQMRIDAKRISDDTMRYMDNYTEEQARARREPSRQIGSIVYS